MQTFANATLSSGGRQIPLKSVSFWFGDSPDGRLVVPPPSTDGSRVYHFTSAMGEIASEARASAAGIKGLARQIERLFLGRAFHCWKCADGRTMAHHRRCPRRGIASPASPAPSAFGARPSR